MLLYEVTAPVIKKLGAEKKKETIINFFNSVY